MEGTTASKREQSEIFVATLAIGCALGVFSHASSALPGGWRWTGNFGALWLAVAFLAGRLTRSVPRGAFYGAVALVAASFVHYVPHRMQREGISLHAFRWPLILWAGVGLLVGLLFGALGTAHARSDRLYSLIGTALLSAVFAAEAYVLYRTRHEAALAVAVPIEAIAAVLTPFVLLKSLRERVLSYATAAAIAPIAVLGLSAFMGVIHRVYPGI